MKLRVCHYPQVPCKPFITEVKDLKQAHLLYNVLADYDLFQFENRIKPDYANATVVEMWDEEENEWISWCDDETGIDDINEYFEQLDKCVHKGRMYLPIGSSRMKAPVLCLDCMEIMY
jgi:hypothetical protein